MAVPPASAAAVDCNGVDAAQAQHTGRRDAQQDAVGFSPRADVDFARHGGQLAALADGMGGLRNGLWAASHAVQALIQTYRDKSSDEPIATALQRALVVANAVVHDEAARLEAVDRMGCTLAVAVVHGQDLHWLNVGDSRVYVCEDGRLRCLSTDHSVSQMLQQRVQRGELRADEARVHPMRHALTSYLGRPEPPLHAGSAAALPLRPGAWVLLCSDGLTQALDDAQIRGLLHGTAQSACDRLLQAVLARQLPEQDNVSVAVLRVPSEQALRVQGVGCRYPSGSDTTQGKGPGDAPALAAERVPPGAPTRLWRLVARWREPLWWGGAAAALGATALLWLGRAPAPLPSPAVGRSGPSVDLLSSPAAPSAVASAATSSAAPASAGPRRPAP